MNLKNMRETFGISQSKLSALSGVNLRTIQSYEREGCDINKASLYTLAALSKTLQCKITDILTDEQLIETLNSL